MHRDKTFANADSQGVTSDAGRLDLFLAPRHNLYELNLVYDALSSKTERQIQVFLPTETGAGDYRLENGVYLPDDQGDYILVSRNTGEYEPSSEVRTNTTLWIRLDEVRGKGTPWWAHLAFETEASLEERTRLPMTAGLLLLESSKLRGGETLEGKLSLREDIHFNRLSRHASFRLRLKKGSSVVSRYANGSQDRRNEEYGLRARLKFTPHLRGESDATQRIERDIYEGVSISSQDLRLFSFSQDVLWSHDDGWEAGLFVSATEGSDDRSATQASLREVKPRVGYSRFQKGRADADFGWVHVTSNRAVLPFALSNGANRGENLRWSARVSFAFSKNFSGSLNYSGRRDANERTFHTGRAEARATF